MGNGKFTSVPFSSPRRGDEDTMPSPRARSSSLHTADISCTASIVSSAYFDFLCGTRDTLRSCGEGILRKAATIRKTRKGTRNQKKRPRTS